MARTVYSSTVASFSTASETEVDALLLDVPAAAAGERWLILASANKNALSNNAVVVWQLDVLQPSDPDGDVTLARSYERTQQIDLGYKAQTLAALWTSQAAGTMTFKLRAYTVLAPYGIELANVWLIAIKLTANDIVSTSTGWVSWTSTAWKERVRAQVPAGTSRTYLAIYYVGYSNNDSLTPGPAMHILQKGVEGSLLRPATAYYKGQQQSTPYCVFRRLVATGGEVCAIEFASPGGALRVQTWDGLVALLDVSSFEGNAYAESLTDSYRTATTYEDKAPLTIQTPPVRHLLLASAVAAPRSTSATGAKQATRLLFDGLELEPGYPSYAITGATYASDYAWARAMIVTPPGGSHTLGWQYASGLSGMTAHLRDAGTFMLQIDISANINRVNGIDRLIFNDAGGARRIEGGKNRSASDTPLLRERPFLSRSIWRRN